MTAEIKTPHCAYEAVNVATGEYSRVVLKRDHPTAPIVAIVEVTRPDAMGKQAWQVAHDSKVQIDVLSRAVIGLSAVLEIERSGGIPPHAPKEPIQYRETERECDWCHKRVRDGTEGAIRGIPWFQCRACNDKAREDDI